MDDHKIRLVIVESPYAATAENSVQEHMEYLTRCLRDCVNKGESPYASHLMLTGCLDDSAPADRKLGIELGLAFRKRVDLRVFYVDYGWSDGMTAARKLYDKEQLHYELRSINW